MQNDNKIKEFIKSKIKIFINESQKFDFDSNKQNIIKYIEKIKIGNVTKHDSPFYTIIVGSPKVGDANKIGFDDNLKNAWKEYFSSKYFNTDGVWSQRNLNFNFDKKSGKDRTLNYYVTINKTKDNILKYLNVLSDLDKRLFTLSNDKKTPIAYKTHRLLDAFVSHNDSLKIYYYDAAIKQDIENIVNNWVRDNNIEIGDRTHKHGVDIKGDNGGSYGQILAQHIDKSLTDLIAKYGDKFTNEQYYEWIKEHMPNLIKQINIKY